MNTSWMQDFDYIRKINFCYNIVLEKRRGIFDFYI